MTRHRHGTTSAVLSVVVFTLLGCGTTTAPASAAGQPSIYAGKARKPRWAYDEVGTPNAHAHNITGRDTTIVILDTGVLLPHEDLGANVKAGELQCANAPNAEDRNGHGTQLAGIVAGRDESSGHATKGAAPGATVIPIKIDCGVVTTEWLSDGLSSAIAHKPDIILLALGGYPPGGLADLEARVNDVANKDILFVIASIWDRASLDALVSLATAPNVIVVAATTVDGTDEVEYRKDRSGHVWAPGRDVETAGIEPDAPLSTTHKSYLMQGTSPAAAMVAGCAALIREQKKPSQAAPGPVGGNLKKAIDEFAMPQPKLPGKSLRCYK